MRHPTLDTIPDRHAHGLSREARRFFALGSLTLALAALIGWGFTRLVPPGEPVPGRVPTAFLLTTGLLFSGSICLERAVGFVRLERQRPFRRWLWISLGVGTLFVGLQWYALTGLLTRREAADFTTEAVAFAFVLAALHGAHFLIALMFVAIVTLRAHDDRYDHEYFWGVRVCAWFWHALLVVWLGILAVCAIAL